MMAYVLSADGENQVYFDDDGVVQEISTLHVDGLMLISGITVEDPKKGETLGIEEEQLEALLSMTKYIKKYDITASAIYFDEAGNLYITYGDSIQIEFGNSDYMSEKVMRLSYILPKLEGMTGTLHLEDWNTENTDIVFEKAE
jgi:cell division protein FtsQ